MKEIHHLSPDKVVDLPLVVLHESQAKCMTVGRYGITSKLCSLSYYEYSYHWYFSIHLVRRYVVKQLLESAEFDMVT